MFDSRIFSWVLLCISCFFISGCVQREPIVVEQSETIKPDWIADHFFEDNENYYFVGYFRIDLHNSNFAYSRARKRLHDFLLQDGRILFEPLEAAMNDDSFVSFIKKYVKYVSSQVMLKARRGKVVYWEKVSYPFAGDMVDGYDYYVKLSLHKKELQQLRKDFIYKEYRIASQLKKTLIQRHLHKLLYND